MVVSEVILVDKQDRPIGSMEKLQAHREGLLHRAITVYLFNPQGDLLLQRRAIDKYHCGGLWSNTCCGHPAPDEPTPAAARRRLFEEMGLHCVLTPIFELQYYLPLSNGLIEHEFDHVYFGITKQVPRLNPAEAMDFRYQSLSQVQQAILQQPGCFTPWFLLTMATIPDYYHAFMHLRRAG
ncbi:isopentenyl-diphosphate Delta-isomerase [Acerihabitans sp. TG2]|uniref:isopentenyl-diphosphate Delta-isomerase n=1 Tax=Acerihabitans sp. TG2 TaxID=3096008 RepID=UPI002B224752|nr:isopentenyl-diphosphate Delta-isomerase [Acerihabitans sp. TG2]MEA9390572.1 isopentenyl-diphosphate Delta-isomerase [Acerihabitans sp. TG2]